MTDDNSIPVDMDNLDKFEKVFYQTEDKTPEAEVVEAEPEVEEVDENGEDHSATDPDTDAEPEDETPDEEDEDGPDEEEAEEEPAPKPEKPKSKAQKRIEELVKEARVAQRERDAERHERALVEQRLAQIEARTKEAQEEPAPLRSRLAPNGPNPDAVTQTGDPVYPLGEFDPAFIQDLIRFTNAETFRAMKDQEAQEAQTRAHNAAQNALQEAWINKVDEVEKEIPDLREDIADLTETFVNIDPGYGEYLAATIMSCENGPRIMHYLSQNIGEAQKIVASGPAAATLKIGRLDDRMSKANHEEDQRNGKIVSAASPPPKARSQGRAAQTVTRADTDDLDAFEKLYYNRK